MRSFSDDARFTVRSLPEIFESMSTLVAKYRARGDIVEPGKKLSREILVNSLFLHFSSLDPASQVLALDDGLVKLRDLLADDGPPASPDLPPASPVKHTGDVRGAVSRKKSG